MGVEGKLPSHRIQQPIVEDHSRVRQLLASIERHIDAPPGADADEWVGTLRNSLASLRETLTAHFAMEEKSGFLPLNLWIGKGIGC